MSDKNEIILGATKEGDLVQFNLDDVKGKVADQMRAFLLNMMPAQAFSAVIENAFKKLTEPRPAKKDRYGKPEGEEQPSELETMVIAEMRKQLVAKVNEWGKVWKETPAAERAKDKLMGDLIERASSGFVAQVAGRIVNDALANLASVTNTAECSGCQRIVAKNVACYNCNTHNY